MIVTDKFVYVHQPKTGGTFVTMALDRINQPRFGLRWIHPTNVLRHERAYRGRHGTYTKVPPKHGTCMRIPDVYRRTEILASVRNPYDKYVSRYEFGWWKRPEYLSYFHTIPGFADRYPNFPRIGFDDFVRLISTAFRRMPNRLDNSEDAYGYDTDEFVRFYFHTPRKIFAEADDAYFFSDSYKNDMFDIHFLRTHHLNQDLYEFLIYKGYSEDETAFVLSEEAVKPRLLALEGYIDSVFPGIGWRMRQGKKSAEKRSWEEYYTPNLKAFVRRRERVLFELFPEFDV